MPWLLVPILPLLLISAQVFPTTSFYLPYLFIPVAALLGRRYGMAGIAIVALGGLIALGPVISVSWIHFGGVPAIYIISVLVCWAAAQPFPLLALAEDGGCWSRPICFVAILLLLPLSLEFPRWEMVDGVDAAFRFSLLPLFIFALFLAGMAGLEIKLALAGLIIATGLGILLQALELDAAIGVMLAGDEAFLRYQLDDLAILITALAAYFAGRDFANPSHPGPSHPGNPWDHAYFMTGLLVVLSQLANLSGQLFPILPPSAGYFGIHGQYLALPLAAFMAGISRGYAGLGFVTGLTLALMLAGNLASIYLTDRGLWLDLELPVMALVFAWLGIRLADLMLDQHRPWPGGRWYLYALLVLLFLPALFSLEDMLDLVKPFLVAIMAAVLASLVAYLRHRLLAAGLTLTGEGWLKLATLVAIAIAVLVNIKSIFDGLMEIAWQLDVPPAFALPAILLLSHLPLALAARMLVDIWPKIAGDLRNLATCWQGR